MEEVLGSRWEPNTASWILKPSNHILNINVIPTNKGYLVLIREAACINDLSIDGEKHYNHSNLRKFILA